MKALRKRYGRGEPTRHVEYMVFVDGTKKKTFQSKHEAFVYGGGWRALGANATAS